MAATEYTAAWLGRIGVAPDPLQLEARAAGLLLSESSAITTLSAYVASGPSVTPAMQNVTSSHSESLFPTIPILPLSGSPFGSAPRNLSSGPTKRPLSGDDREPNGAGKKKAKKEDAGHSPDAKLTDKSCKRCRERKVKCDRTLPICTHCKVRKEDCDLTAIVPKGKSSPKDAESAERIAKLEARLAELESTLPHSQTGSTASSITPSLPVSSNSPPWPSQYIVSPTSATSSTASDSPPTNIGEGSLDWRLAVPAMKQSLSQTLCDSFFKSCCFLLPTFSFFRARVPDFRADSATLGGAAKTAVAVFSAVGGRTEAHSALLGIEISPTDSLDHPNAPLLNAGVRRETACRKLISKAYTLAFENGLEDEATIENLAALLALVQMSIFVELKPKKSRTFLRAAVDHFKELQDNAETDQLRSDIKKAFAMAIYYSDAITSAYAQKSCFISDADLPVYFDNATIVVPDLPTQDLSLLLEALFNGPLPHSHSLKTATHLLICWTAACQRMFAKLASPPSKSTEVFEAGILKLWAAVDMTRTAVQRIQTAIFGFGDELLHSHDHSTHVHESDFLSRVIRCDRDLLDLIAMSYMRLKQLPSPGLPLLLQSSLSRVRKGLKTLAFYAKVYICGADLHMIFHHVFQLELIPEWTLLVKQRVGDPGGPVDASEELTPTELGWYIEGLQHACFYTPSAERRLAELQPRFQELTPYSGLASPLPSAESAMYAMSASLPPSPSASADLPPMDFDFDSFVNEGSFGMFSQGDSSLSDSFTGSSELGWLGSGQY